LILKDILSFGVWAETLCTHIRRLARMRPITMNPVTKIPAGAMLTGAVSRSGKVVGRSATDGQGTTTNYDARGKVLSREGNQR
jgi:YD repeat-containing protein